MYPKLQGSGSDPLKCWVRCDWLCAGWLHCSNCWCSSSLCLYRQSLSSVVRHPKKCIQGFKSTQRWELSDKKAECMEVLLRDEQLPQRDKRKRHSADYSSFESPIVCIRLVILWSLFNKLRFFLNILYSMTQILSLKPVFLSDLYGGTYGSNQIHKAMTKVTI